MVDWDLGQYERTAAELEPVAEHVVALAAIARGERALDLGCGTGNAALAAGQAGARVTGVDPATRLIDVARARAAQDGLEADFIVASAEDLPFDDATFDVVLSIFGVIFATDAERALHELMRVLRPGGRALISAWLPGGAISKATGVIRRAVAAATGVEPKSFGWQDPAVMGAAVERLGGKASFDEGELAISSGSPEHYYAEGLQHHPLSVAARPVLEAAGTYDEASRAFLAALQEGNEDPDAFRVTSRYRIARITRA